MPWCEPCNKWRAPNALLADGTCPRCGNAVDLGDVASAAAASASVEVRGAGAATEAGAVRTEAEHKIPWHFWVMVAAATIYLGWRVIQGLIALF